MPESSWPESDSFSELDPLEALLADFTLPSEFDEQPEQPSYSGSNRRRRAAVVLVMIWGGTVALHLVTWGYWLIAGLATIMGIHAVRVLLARPLPLPMPLVLDAPDQLPFVSLLVAAKNEEAVITRLVETLCQLDYPASRYEVWIVDDNSSDRTPVLLEGLIQKYAQLRLLRRSADATGGKSGALNQVLPLTQGELIAVFDADAQVEPDLLRRVLPLFERADLGAVQVRKAIANVSNNAWIRGQISEMAVDTYIQRQRIALGGIGELRGNGQFVRRLALEQCGGWNEETITDDLDLTIRLHLEGWDIEVLVDPTVQEEGVTRAIALWHQRNRWAEGGYQRYLDYWKPILQNRMGFRKTFDMVLFWISQYALPTAAIPDTFMAVLRHHPLLLAPITALSIMLSLLGMVIGSYQIRQAQMGSKSLPDRGIFTSLNILFQAVYGTLYMLHWLPIIASMAVRLSIRPKRLKWVKTIHHGESA
jgi:1,2-diacylglycerol 3-beta-glucosyltransferase